jgi:CO/xanthine dehydrogenase Mo-binding subunit
MTPESLKAHPLLRQWLGFGPEGQVRALSGKVDLGQGISHALSLIVAEELRLSPAQINMVAASTHTSPDEQVTSGSLSVQHSGSALRCAAAHWRENCRLAMAQQCGVDVTSVWCEEGVFHVSTTGQSASYAQLTNPELLSTPIETAHVNSPNACQDMSAASDIAHAMRPDVASKVFGEFEYIHDRVLPNMCHGMVFRPATLAAEVIASEMQALVHDLEQQSGVLCVHHEGVLLGVLTETEYALSKIVRQIEDGVAHGKFWRCLAEVPDPLDLTGWLKAQASDTTVVVDTTASSLPANLSYQSAEFHRPFLQHASIGLCCALAQYTEDTQQLEVWSHSQGIYNLRRDLALAFYRQLEQVQVSHAEGAGCYGHNGADDVAFDAAWLAQLMPGRPVRVQWTRQAELGHSPLAPAMAVAIQAGLNDEGHIAEWTQTVWSQGHGTRPGRGKTPALLGTWQTAQHQPVTMAVNAAMTVGGGSERNAQPPYDIDSVKVLNHRVLNMPFRVSAMRALGAPANVFAAESFMDELALLCSKDPLAFRLAHLRGAGQERAAAVLQKATDMADWTAARPSNKPEGWGRGLAYARYKNTGAFCAVVVELVMAEKVKLHKLWVAVDLGHVVDPDGAVNQIEGGALQAASWALCESAQLSPQGIASNTWANYPIFKFSDIPAVDVCLIDPMHQPSLGAGECSSGPTCAAIGNAIFDAIGVRMRAMPFTPENIIKTIEAEPASASS